MARPHIVLLGDSTLDNAAYVAGGPDVVALLREELAGEGKATLLAVDGSVVGGVARQLATLPVDATHLAVSTGGNDALGCSWVLQERTASVGEAVARLGELQASFRAEHLAMLQAVTARGLPTAVATIYDADFEPPHGPIVATALSVFNDAITRNAFSLGVDLVDLRLICNAPADYANPIEPSVAGGRKIARALAAFVRATSRPGAASRVFV
jgi:hypothetical protein